MSSSLHRLRVVQKDVFLRRRTHPVCYQCQQYASSVPPTHPMVVETFSGPAKPPKPYFARPPPRTHLPRIQKRWPIILASAAIGISAWAGFLFYATNQEKLTSSVVNQIMRSVKDDAQLRELLGDAIRFEPEWYLNGDPWINGSINIVSGRVDLSFRLKGHKGAGTLYFTSVRKAKGEQFTILRFRVIGDDGTVVNISVAPQLS